MGSVGDWRTEKRKRDGSVKVINGNIYARIQYVDPVTGKRKEKLRRAESCTHARELIRSMRAELERGGPIALDSSRITFAELVARFETINLVPARYENGIKIAGRRSVAPLRSSLKPIINHFGRRLVRDIKLSDVESYKLARLQTPVQFGQSKNQHSRQTVESPKRNRKLASVNRELALLRSIFNFAKAEDLIIKSPFDGRGGLVSLSAEGHRERILSVEEERHLLEECVGPRSHLRSIIIVAVDTGMRRGELLKLRWQDVDFDECTILIRAFNSKTERPRLVPLADRTWKELRSLWNESSKNRDGLVFQIKNNFKHAWMTACKLAAIDGLRFHDLRHTATTRMIRAGIPSAEVMKITGHTQIKTFLRYLNLTNESLRSSAAALDQYHTDSGLENLEVVKITKLVG